MEDYFMSEGMQMKTMKKKRKEVAELDQVNHDFSDFSLSSHARKIRRLDAHLPPILEEEEAEFSAGQNQLKPGGPIIEELPSENQEKAIVLFKPVNASPVFSVHSDLISGFKGINFSYPIGFSDSFQVLIMSALSNYYDLMGFTDQFMWSSHFCLKPSAEEDGDSNQCKAVVPWVQSQLLTAPSVAVPQSESQEELMEAEEKGAETMEIDESMAGKDTADADGFGGVGGVWTSDEGFPQWQQQHCMIPQPPHNPITPITWLQ